MENEGEPSNDQDTEPAGLPVTVGAGDVHWLFSSTVSFESPAMEKEAVPNCGSYKTSAPTAAAGGLPAASRAAEVGIEIAIVDAEASFVGVVRAV